MARTAEKKTAATASKKRKSKEQATPKKSVKKVKSEQKKTKPIKKQTFTRQLRTVTKEQESNKTVGARAPFQKFVKAILNDDTLVPKLDGKLKVDRITQEALDSLRQLVDSTFLNAMCISRDAVIKSSMKKNGRKSMMPEDVHMAIKQYMSQQPSSFSLDEIEKYLPYGDDIPETTMVRKSQSAQEGPAPTD